MELTHIHRLNFARVNVSGGDIIGQLVQLRLE